MNRDKAIDQVSRAVLAATSPGARRLRAREQWTELEATGEAAECSESTRAAFGPGDASGEAFDTACVELLLPEEQAKLVGVTSDYLERRLVALTGIRASVEGEAEARTECPCCGYASLPEDGFFEVCLVCFWQNDGGAAGANSLSLEEGKKNFERLGAMEERFRDAVLPDGKERYRHGSRSDDPLDRGLARGR